MERVNLAIEYKGEVRHYTAAVSRYGYTYRIYVEIEGLGINFEPDEEGRFRGIIDEQEKDKLRRLDVQLIQAIAAELEAELGS